MKPNTVTPPPQVQSLIDNYKSSTPTPTQAAPTGNNWYSQLKQGAYRPSQPATKEDSGVIGKVAGATQAVLNPASILLKPFADKVGAGVIKDFKTRDTNEEKIARSSTSAPSKLLQSAGNAAGLVGDAVGETAKAALPQPVKDVIKAGAGAIADTPAAQALAKAWNDFEAAHPEFAGNIKATGDIASILPIGKAAQVGEKAVQAGMEGAEKLVPAVAPAIKDAKNAAASAIKNSGVTKPIQAVKNAIIKQPEKPVEHVLKETHVDDFDKYASIAKKAAENNKNITPLEHVGTRAQDALDTIQRKLTNFGKNKTAVLNKAAVGNKPVGNIVTKFRQDLSNAAKTLSVDGDSNLVQRVLTDAKNLGNNPAAKDVDAFIDKVQDHIYAARRDLTIPVTDRGTGAVRKVLGQLNGSLKNQLPEAYRNTNALYHDLVGVRDELNLKLGQEGEKGGALMKRVFSPSDNNTKKMFADVLKHTGVDLTNEATLAKFLMETVGDARQKSMLEHLGIAHIPTAHGLVIAGLKKGKEFLNSPEKLIERARSMTKQSR